jgi:capsid protein
VPRFATSFTRAVIARALAGRTSFGVRRSLTRDGEDPTWQSADNPGAIYEYAERRWGKAFADRFLKAAVGAVTSTSPIAAVGSSDDEFFSAVLEASLLGRLRGLREIPFNVRLLRMLTKTRGYWVGQSKAIPLSKPVLTGSILPKMKVAAIIVSTIEALDAANIMTEARFDEDLRNAIVGAIDESFLDSNNAGVADEMPAAVTNGVTPIASTDNPATDLAALVADFAGDLSAAYWVSDPLTFAQAALSRDAGGSFQFPDLGPRGGSALGIPALASNYSPRDSSGGQIALIDPTGIAAGMESIEVSRSLSATLEMSDAPTGATDTPSAHTAVPVSLFQTDSVALRALVHANWEVQRPSVSVLTGADYPMAVAP